jgi:hypothetical protein
MGTSATHTGITATAVAPGSGLVFDLIKPNSKALTAFSSDPLCHLPHYFVTAQKKPEKNPKSGEETKTLSLFSNLTFVTGAMCLPHRLYEVRASPICQGVVCKDAVMAIEEVFSRCRRPTKQLHLRRLGIFMSASLQMNGRLPWRDRGNPKPSPKKGTASNPLRSDNSSTPFFGRQRPKGPLKATQRLFLKIVDSRVGTTVGR